MLKRGKVTSQGELVEARYEPSPLDPKIYTPLLTPPLLFFGIFLSGLLCPAGHLHYRVSPFPSSRQLKTPNQYFLFPFLPFCFWQTPIRNGTPNSPSPHLWSWEPVHLISAGDPASSVLNRQRLTHKATPKRQDELGDSTFIRFMKENAVPFKSMLSESSEVGKKSKRSRSRADVSRWA